MAGKLQKFSSQVDLDLQFGAARFTPRSQYDENRPCVAVLTSGGDSPGMNPAVRAIVRGALHQGYRVYGIRDGYRGLCRGSDEDIVELNWIDVSGIIHKGGTFLGTARCEDFRTTKGRKKVVLNLISRGINSLIIIGGDGSLTGASILHKEWTGYVDELLNEMAEEEKSSGWFSKYWKDREEEIRTLQVVGLVGSIDNDMGNTSMTIGCDSALHRICTALDIISSTAASHQRAFVVEVMGRMCGWLALKAAVACGAEFVFFPENPTPLDWPQKVIDAVKKSVNQEKRSAIVIVAEGARDTNLEHISAEAVRKTLEDAGVDSRLTILGHVQRGGSPSFYDRAHSMLLGYSAVQEMVKGTAKAEPQMICVDGLFHTCTRTIAECLATSKEISTQVNEKDYLKAMSLRGEGFLRSHEAMLSLVTSKRKVEKPGLHNIALFHVGACAPGMNAVTRSFVRLALDKGYSTYGVTGGIKGLENANFHLMSWMDVDGWCPLGGAKLGTSRFATASKMDVKKVCESLKKYKIKTLAMIGGWDGYLCMMYLKKHANDYPFLKKINIFLIPCTISNNLPCTSYCIGTDTALNSIVEAVDKIKESAIAQRRIYVIEVMGANCGYLCSMGSFATGAEKTFCPEVPLTLESLKKDLDDVKESFAHAKPMALFFTTEKTSKVFDTKFLAKLFKSQSDGAYDVRVSILGHLQQGGSPSPMDRFLGVEIVAECMNRIEEYASSDRTNEFQVVGLQKGIVTFSDASQIHEEMDIQQRRPKHEWWMNSFSNISKQYAEWAEKPEVY
eukprot:CAMPEP_0206205796 /NCGR_PEP_ID=MMETSP0166-20121206/14472_1 /ASSEMBLY_ACC=CAM_ASM_000260 /TAXON_ID=95228 /ORGANISM="Vannella robusta, Strain DIVA3 518/3/11/1/6" /LENGTH=786 /DNA_ID=CAMNT_0053625961 /DNA_START=97 /DNA_END=2454 /DNA_ORIENTATION=+